MFLDFFTGRRSRSLVPMFFLIFVISCSPPEVILPIDEIGATNWFDKGVVVSVDPIASKVGLEILRKGGNAVDAAIATGFALAVTHPSAGNIGGGGFMLIRLAKTDAVYALDYREKAPNASTWRMFLDDDNEIDRDKSGVGYLVIGVPGTVRGFWNANKRFGTMQWRDLVQPSIVLAREGFVVDKFLANSLKTQAKFMDRFLEFGLAYRKQDSSYFEPGEMMFLPDLAWTLEQIRDNGVAGFYQGDVAKRLVSDIQANGGIITLDDLTAYTAPIRQPIHFRYRGYDVYGMPPPSSGGVTTAQILNILENYDLYRFNRRDPEVIHILAEAMRIGFYNRAKYLGDTDFVEVDLTRLISKEFVEQFIPRISRGKTMTSNELGQEILTRDEGTETTHFSVVDRAGNMVANTYTIEQSYGSRVIAKGTGFLLNNQMHDFNMNPGATDTNGMIGTLPNLIVPGKRMLSSMSPTLVLRDGDPFLITGSPGGRSIINTVLQVILNVIDFGMGIQAAVDEPRIHHQWMPDRLNIEKALGAIEWNLRKRGHRTSIVERQGDAHSIMVLDGRMFPGVDRRLRGSAIGY